MNTTDRHPKLESNQRIQFVKVVEDGAMARFFGLRPLSEALEERSAPKQQVPRAVKRKKIKHQ
jgi:hypothetical protein